MMLKDNNFISAVVYLHNDGARAVEFCRTVAAELDANFKQYELVVVDDACTDDTVKQLRAWGREQDAPLTILHMSIYHGLEDAMNAGLDAAIGDYVYEFDSTELCYAPPLIMQAYRAALDGSDIVSVCPRTVRGGSIVGDHEVLFCGPDEVITLRHTAYSRNIFANGAINAAVYLAKKEPGLYNMSNMIAEM
mgnify:CR=1 FL=1